MNKLAKCVILCAFISGTVGLQAADKVKKPKAPKDPAAAEKAFTKLDKDGDGKISSVEFVGKREGEKADKAKTAFGKKDKDSDGFLSKTEMAPGPKGGAKKKKKDV